MKRIVTIIIIILSIVVVGMFLISSHNENTDVTINQTKVGVIMIGRYDDKSYNQSHYEAIENTADELNLNVIYRENVPEDERSKDVMEELIADGCEIIICDSFNYGDWVLQVAKKHPEIYFFHASGVKSSNNVATYFGRIYQMRYLSGIVAGLQTETNEIGYVAAFPISEVNRGINAFTLGVRQVNPEAVVYVNWCGSWTDDMAAGEATLELIKDYNIDVLAMHTDSNKVLDMAKSHGIWSVGYNVDNSEKYADTFLTAPVWEWENYYTPYILRCLQGKFSGENYWEGISTGVVGLAPLTENVKEGTEAVVEEAMKKLESGVFDVFYGPVRDNEGNIRIGEGENISDNVMLNSFDWYVEGVEVYE